eukprot:837632-Alexandrium_andersonii.AAC.1
MCLDCVNDAHKGLDGKPVSGPILAEPVLVAVEQDQCEAEEGIGFAAMQLALLIGARAEHAGQELLHLRVGASAGQLCCVPAKQLPLQAADAEVHDVCCRAHNPPSIRIQQAPHKGA